VHAGDIVNQAKDSDAKFVVSSASCVVKSMDVKRRLPQQINVMPPLSLNAAHAANKRNKP